ncbi:MAG: hypothetical protein WD032_03480 [Nitrospirales bacterium]
MGTPSKTQIVNVLSQKYGRHFSKEFGNSLQEGMPSALFQGRTTSLLVRARIRSAITASIRVGRDTLHRGVIARGSQSPS